MINEKRLLDNFLEYVQIDSPTREELEFANYLMEKMKGLGFEVKMDKAGEKVGSNAGNLICKLKGNSPGKPILFSAHMDTVSPSRGIQPIIKGDTIYSKGDTILGSDDKAGIAAIIEAMESLVENDLPHGDIEISFSIFEESGLFGVKNIDPSEFSSKSCYVLDSGGSPGEIIVEGPAQNEIKVEFIGKTAHAGVAPEEGISAIEMAAHAISNMNLLRIDEETTANIGSIRGGEATNIVTETVKIHCEARSLKNHKLEEQTQAMLKACQDAAQKFAGKVNIEVNNKYSSFSLDEDSDTVKMAIKASENLGFKTFTTSSGGGSDTNIWNSYGIEAVNLGVGMKNCHTKEEHIKIKDLEDSARLVLELVKLYA